MEFVFGLVILALAGSLTHFALSRAEDVINQRVRTYDYYVDRLRTEISGLAAFAERWARRSKAVSLEPCVVAESGTDLGELFQWMMAEQRAFLHTRPTETRWRVARHRERSWNWRPPWRVATAARTRMEVSSRKLSAEDRWVQVSLMKPISEFEWVQVPFMKGSTEDQRPQVSLRLPTEEIHEFPLTLYFGTGQSPALHAALQVMLQVPRETKSAKAGVPPIKAAIRAHPKAPSARGLEGLAWARQQKGTERCG